MDEVVVLSIPQIIITFMAATKVIMICGSFNTTDHYYFRGSHGDSVSIDELHAQPP